MSVIVPVEPHDADLLIPEAHERKRRRRWVRGLAVVMVAVVAIGGLLIYRSVASARTARPLGRPVGAMSAQSLCRQANLPYPVTSTTLTTVGAERGWEHNLFPSDAPTAIAAWCWERASSTSYMVYAVTNNEVPIAVAGIVGFHIVTPPSGSPDQVFNNSAH